MPEASGDGPTIRETATLEQAVRWVAYGLPPLESRIEHLHDYPPIVEYVRDDPAEAARLRGDPLDVAGFPQRLVGEKAVDRALKAILREMAYRRLAPTSTAIYCRGDEASSYGDIYGKIIYHWHPVERGLEVPASYWDVRLIRWGDWLGGYLEFYDEGIVGRVCLIEFDFQKLREIFPWKEPKRSLPTATVEVKAGKPGPPPAKVERAKAIAAALLNERGDDPTSINGAVYERNVAAAWDAVHGPGTAPSPKTIRRALDDLADGERTLVAAKAAGWRWED